MSLFTEAAGQVVTKSSVDIDYSPLANGITTQLQWRNRLFSLEFEFEHTIPFQELPQDKQVKAIKMGQGADNLVLGEVFGIGKHAYEAYVYRKGKLEKFDL